MDDKLADRVRRMIREANVRLADAEILEQSPAAASDSAAMLTVFGFEVLLKAALLASGAKKATSHNYWALWQALPGSAQQQILDVALDRMPGDVEFSKLEALLTDFEFVFVKARYHYELSLDAR